MTTTDISYTDARREYLVDISVRELVGMVDEASAKISQKNKEDGVVRVTLAPEEEAARSRAKEGVKEALVASLQDTVRGALVNMTDEQVEARITNIEQNIAV